MELVSPQDGGNESPTLGWAQVIWLSCLSFLLALRASISHVVVTGIGMRVRSPSNRHRTKILTPHNLPSGGWMVKVCGLGNLGVDFRLTPNFNRLE